MNPLLSVNHLEVSFHHHKRKVKAVRDVSFSIMPHETIGVVGESGCGKSVMARALLRLFSSPSARIDSGEIFFEGRNLLSLSEKELQKIRGKDIGIIFQDPMTSLNPTMKIGHQITENILQHNPLICIEKAQENCINLLNLVGIPEPDLRYHQYPHELSGGMRQRVMIAIALAPAPKLLIADEPTTALDVTIQAQILSLLKSIQKKTGTSILFITHDLSIIAGFCDKVMVMYAGKIIEKATTETLFSHPKHPYTQKLLDSLPRLHLLKDFLLKPIPGSPPDLSNFSSGCSFLPRCDRPLKICQVDSPPLYQLAANHQCACFYHDQRYLSREKNL